MLRLAIPREPFWIDIGAGVRFRVRPPTTSLMETARASCRRELDKLRKARDELVAVGATVDGLPDLSNGDVFDGEFSALLARELARFSLVEWEGVAMPDGTVAPLTERTIAMAMSIDPVARTFMALYLTSLEGLVAEGNGSALAPNGNSDAGANTATDVEPSAATAA